MALRTDKISGVVTCVFGIALIGFSASGLAMVTLQRFMISHMPQMSESGSAGGVSPVVAMRAIHSVWVVYLPIMLAGGIIFTLAGFYIYRGSRIARRIAQVDALCGYVWLVAYTIACIPVMDAFMPAPDVFPAAMVSAYKWVAIGVSLVMGALFPTGLLILLSRPREQAKETA